MFVVMKTGDEYSEDIPLVCSTSKEKCEEYVKKAQEIYQERKKQYDRLYEFVSDYMANNPRKEVKRVIKKVPRWDTGLSLNQITTEMRKEREDIQKYNNSIADELMEIERNWQETFAKAKAKWFQETGIDPLIDYEESLEPTFTIQHIPVI